MVARLECGRSWVQSPNTRKLVLAAPLMSTPGVNTKISLLQVIICSSVANVNIWFVVSLSDHCRNPTHVGTCI